MCSLVVDEILDGLTLELNCQEYAVNIVVGVRQKLISSEDGSVTWNKEL